MGGCGHSCGQQSVSNLKWGLVYLLYPVVFFTHIDATCSWDAEHSSLTNWVTTIQSGPGCKFHVHPARLQESSQYNLKYNVKLMSSRGEVEFCG